MEDHLHKSGGLLAEKRRYDAMIPGESAWQAKNRPWDWTTNLRSQIGDRALQITNRISAIENRK
jgi:hypothetical protein